MKPRIPSASVSPTAVEALTPAMDACLAALAAHLESPAAADAWAALCAGRADLARQAAAFAGQPGEAAAARLLTDWQIKLAGSGVLDREGSAGDLALAAELSARGVVGLVAAMTLVPAWQWPAAPSLAAVPEALWTPYTAWLFHAPQSFSAVGHAEAHAAHTLQRLEELGQLVAARSSSHAVHDALAAFASTSKAMPLTLCGDSLRRHLALRGRLLMEWGAVDRNAVVLPRARAGRLLRVGFIGRDFGPAAETRATLPLFEELDSARFEVRLFALHHHGTVIEKYARGCAAAFTLLPGALEAQLQVLRSAELDALVFSSDLTSACNEITRLALHRVAPLQIVSTAACTTGLPEIDLFFAGCADGLADAPEHFTERLGLVSGPVRFFNLETDRAVPARTWSRSDIGLSEKSMLFVTAANFRRITPAMRDLWVLLLATVPGARLLVHPFRPDEASPGEIERFCADFDRVLAAHGVAAERLIISSVRFPSRTDVGELLKLGDVYLDTHPCSGVHAVVDALEHGLPVVTCEGAMLRSRLAATLLRSLGLDELVVPDDEAYLALCAELAYEPAARAALRTRVAAAMERAPLFLDRLAASDAFGALLEAAHDELCANGHAAFRRERAPLLVPNLAAPACRQARGRKLLAAGDAARAVTYFLAAIQHDEKNAALWRELADALRRTNRMNEAVQCLQACLQLDPRGTDAWRLLADLAGSLGHAGLHSEATAMIAKLSAAAVAADEERQRVLIYTDDSGSGDVAQYNHSLVVGLTVAGCGVACAQSESDSPLVAAQRELGVIHHWIPFDTGSDFARTADDVAAARHLLEQAKPDLVIFSDRTPVSNLAARDAAHQLGLPYVVVVGQVSAQQADLHKALLGRLALQYARARAVVVSSRDNLELLQNRFGLAASAGQVVHPGRPEHFFAPRDETVRARLRAELSLPDDAVVCFTAARLTATKGFLCQIVAAKHLVALPGCAKLHFVWAGEGEYRTMIEEAVAVSGLKGRIHLLGHRRDVAAWYDAADIFALPSDLEGMPLAIMEAMAKGLPVVATAVGGIPEELGPTGQLLPAPGQNRPALVNQLIRTLHLWTRDASLRRIVGEAGRLRAEAIFRESLMIERTVALVSEQLAKPAAAAVSA